MDVFNLVAKIALDTKEYEGGLNDAQGKMAGFASKLKGGLATAAKVGGAALTAAAGAVTAMTKASVDNFKDYQQLVGGVETLFGNSAQKVISDAQNAFKTAGLSMNEYMETSIQSAAALINSLGGDQATAAELMNMSITDMADNVNKMGTSMEAVQNAYRGFSRGNFTMLDNLALGFAGTKQGMEELLAKAQQLSGIKYDISSYSDIVEAIHVVQTEMGITGTTAKEANETISGSLAAVKSAWQNLLTGLADGNADMSTLVGNVVESVKTAANNLLPVIKQALIGIAQMISELAPAIAEMIPELIVATVPDLLQAAVTLVMTLIQALGNMGPQLLDAALDILNMLIDALIDNLDLIIEFAIQFVVSMAEGLIGALPTLIEKIPQIVSAIVDALVDNAPQLFVAAGEIIAQLAIGIVESIPALFDAAKEIVETVVTTVAELPKMAFEWGVDLIAGFADGIATKITGLKDTVKNVANTVKDFLGFSEPDKGPLSDFHTYAPDMMELFAQGIRDNQKLIPDSFNTALNLGTPNAQGGAGGASQENSQPIPIVFELVNEIDGTIFARKSYKYFIDEKQRRGGVEQLAF